MSTNEISVIRLDVKSRNIEDGDENKTKESNKLLKNTASYWNVLHIFTVIGATALYLSPQMTIPRHNPILYQSYWPVYMIVLATLALSGTIDLVVTVYCFTSQRKVVTSGVFVKNILWLMVIILLLYCISYLVWVQYFEMNFPMPFLGLFLHFPGFIGQVSGVWFLLPQDLLSQNDFRRQLKICFMYWLWWIFLNIQKDVLSFVFKTLTGFWQSIIAFIIPMLREWNK